MKNKSKKIILCVLSILLLLILASCDKTIKYPYKHLGLYDTKTQQYIEIGDSKDKIDKIFGNEGTSYTGFYSNHYKYNGDIVIAYDRNNQVEGINFSFDKSIYDVSTEDKKRYEMPDGINMASTVTEFINKYEYVYEGVDLYIFLEKRKNDIILLDKATFLQALTDKQEDIYIIDIGYFSYDSLSHIGIEKVDGASPDDYDGLEELDKSMN